MIEVTNAGYGYVAKPVILFKRRVISLVIPAREVRRRLSLVRRHDAQRGETAKWWRRKFDADFAKMQGERHNNLRRGTRQV